MAETLKPCPWCRSEAVRAGSHDYLARRVRCPRTGCPGGFCLIPEQLWNDRPTESAAAAQAREEAIEECAKVCASVDADIDNDSIDSSVAGECERRIRALSSRPSGGAAS